MKAITKCIIFNKKQLNLNGFVCSELNTAFAIHGKCSFKILATLFAYFITVL